MFVYLQGNNTKGIPANHYVLINPGEHLGTSKVLAAWTEKTPMGDGIQGKTFPVHFVNGRADVEDAIGEYLVKYNHAQRQRWTPPRAPWEDD